MNPKIIAFYLPQYYPVKENNEWFGQGFTEWTNVAKAKPLFKNHNQPRVPRDLGFYDLRIPEVREAQAYLAKEAGIDAFCYYHYWFGNGRLMLERPLQEVIQLGEPDFPFCICWANHSWYKKHWNPDVKQIDQTLLIEQTYPGKEDIINHFNYLLPALKDPRYFRKDGKLLFVIYDIKSIPDYNNFKSTWNKLAIENNLPGFYFISYTTKTEEVKEYPFSETDGVILALHSNIMNKDYDSPFKKRVQFIKTKISEKTNKPLFKYSYEEAMSYFIDPICQQHNVIPVIIPNWDYTPRRGAGGLILYEATPSLFGKHVRQVLSLLNNKPERDQIVFVKSWNEWGEGNYMEPDLTYGKGYIEELRRAKEEVRE